MAPLITPEEALRLGELGRPDEIEALVERAWSVRVERFADSTDMCSLVNAKSGGCAEAAASVRNREGARSTTVRYQGRMRTRWAFELAEIKRGGKVHVAVSRRHYTDVEYTTTLLRRSYREGGKVRNETVGNLSHLEQRMIDGLRAMIAGRRLVDLDEEFEIVRSVPHGHVAAVLGVLRSLDLERLLCRERCRERDLCVAMIAQRLLAPCSKLSTTRLVHDYALRSSHWARSRRPSCSGRWTGCCPVRSGSRRRSRAVTSPGRGSCSMTSRRATWRDAL